MHTDKGHYATKHPAGTMVEDRISQAIRQRLEEGRITCPAAHRLAGELGSTAAVIGVGIDLLEGRIIRCQLGLFGYGKEKKKVRPSAELTSEMKDALAEAAPEGRLTCKRLWEIADSMRISRLEAACACERMHIKIRECQLGAF